MPIARIRTLDPEAISFLASKLAASGYQLQFAAPNEEQLDEADLEIIVTRMDSATALQQAQIQAEEMDADVTVYPGALSPIAHVNDIEEQAHTPLHPAELELLAAEIPNAPGRLPQTRAPWTTPYHADVLQEASEPALGTPASASDAKVEREHSHVMRETAGTLVANVKHGAGVLGNIAQSMGSRVAEWRRRSQLAKQQRRDQEDVALTSRAAKVPAQRLQLVTPPRRLSSRDRQYRRAAIVAASVLGVFALGWGLFGKGGPASPIRNSNLSNVQQQTPFGAASLSAPAQPAPVSMQPPSKQIAPVRKTTTKPVATRRNRTARVHRHVARSDDGEVVVRHFGSKPVAQQAKVKTKDGVKVITEE